MRPAKVDHGFNREKHACFQFYSVAQLAIAWLLHKPGITSPIIGTSKMPQLDDAIAAMNIKLSSEDIAYLEELYIPHCISGHT